MTLCSQQACMASFAVRESACQPTMQADIGEAMSTLATVRNYFDPATYKGIRQPKK